MSLLDYTLLVIFIASMAVISEVFTDKRFDQLERQVYAVSLCGWENEVE